MFTDETFINPFPGLRAFEEEEDILFFGREKQVDELLKKLRTGRFLAVIGSSGSGKSSLVKSGLIPALYSGFMSGVGSQWRICTFRPGNDPIGNMARGLTEDGVLFDPQDEQEKMTMAAINESVLRRSSLGLTEVYRQSNIDTKNNLLILVDQFEELFRFSKFEKDAKEVKRDSVAFINLLLNASEQRELPIYVVFTMRSDFLGDCTEFRGFPEAINEGQYLVPRMTREERRDAIAGPIAVGGADISQRLVNQLLNDVGDNPDQLPILQHALMRTWDVWKKKDTPDVPIDIPDYEAIGTMQHALSEHAEEAYSELGTERKRKICEVLFKALTDRGSDARGIRRPRKLKEICLLAEAPLAEVTEVIDVFRQSGRAFLMPPQGVKLSEETIIDISHESLMRVWDRLITWVDEENESAEVYLRLCEAADLYETGKGGLWRDPELQVALKWKDAHGPNATWASRYNTMFDKAMLFLEYSRQQQELELKHKEEQQRKRLKRARAIATFISGIAVIALFLAIYSFEQKNKADKQTRKAIESEKKAIASSKEALEQRNRAIASQREALRQKEHADTAKAIAEAQKQKADQERANAERSEQEALRQRAHAQLQETIAKTNEQKAREQKEIAEEQEQRAIASKQRALEAQAVSFRLKELAEARNMANRAVLLLNDKKYNESQAVAMQAYTKNDSNRGPVQNADIYNALHVNWVRQMNNRNQSVFHKQAVKSVAGYKNLAFSADESGTVAMFRVEDNRFNRLDAINLKEDIRAIVPSQDGRFVMAFAAGGNGFFMAADEGTGLRELQKLSYGGVPKRAMVHQNEIYLLTTEGIFKWHIDRDNVIADGNRPNTGIYACALTASGKFVVGTANTVAVYSNWLMEGSPERVYKTDGLVTSIAVDPTERYIALGTTFGMVRIIDQVSGAAGYKQPLHLSAVNDLKFGRTPAGQLQLATASSDNTVKLIDVSSALRGGNEEDVLTLMGHTKWVYALSYLSDGSLVSVGEDFRVISWKPSTSELYKSLKALSK